MIEKINIKKIYYNGILNGNIKEIKLVGSSMLPTISSGTVLKISNNFKLKVGDIVVVDDTHRPIFVVHRIKSIDRRNNRIVICGDNEDISKSMTVDSSQVIAKVIGINNETLLMKKYNIVIDLPFSTASSFNSKSYEIYQSIISKNKNAKYFDYNLDFNLQIYGETYIKSFYSKFNVTEDDYKIFSQQLVFLRAIASNKYKIYRWTHSHLTLCNPFEEKEIKNTIKNHKRTIYYKFFKTKLTHLKNELIKNKIDINNVNFFVSVEDFNKLISSIIFSKVLHEVLGILPVLIDNSQLFNGNYSTSFINKYFFKIFPSYLINRDVNSLCTTYDNINFSNYVSKEKIAKLRIMKECYYKKCLFCDRHSNDNFCFPLSNIFNKIKSLYNIGVVNIIFEDDCLVPSQIKKLLEMLSLHNIKIQWKGTFRFEELLNNEKLIKYFAEHGCKMLFFGLESFSQSLLNKMDKGIKVGTALNILKFCKKYNILTSVSLLFGFPLETKNDLIITYNALVKYIDLVSCFEINYFMPTKNCKIITKDNKINYFTQSDIIKDDHIEIIKKINSYINSYKTNSYYIRDYLCWLT